jgi:hypothetical protein
MTLSVWTAYRDPKEWVMIIVYDKQAGYLFAGYSAHVLDRLRNKFRDITTNDIFSVIVWDCLHCQPADVSHPFHHFGKV